MVTEPDRLSVEGGGFYFNMTGREGMNNQSGNFFVLALTGQQRLWKAFWVGALGIPLLDLAFLLPAFALNPSRVVFHIYAATIAFILLGTWSYCVWRCSFNSTARGWGYIARAYVIFISLIVAFAFIDGYPK
jgi:hypothetical protein